MARRTELDSLAEWVDKTARINQSVEASRVANLRTIMREQDAERDERRRFHERQRELERVWVVYAWQDWATTRQGRRVLTLHLEYPRWVLCGFMRRRSRRKPQTVGRLFARVRRRLGIDRKTEVKLVDLSTAQKAVRRGTLWRGMLLFTPPHRQHAYKPEAPIAQAKIVKPPKARHTVLRKDRSPRFHGKTTMFIALGRNTWDRVDGYYYLGPLTATSPEDARREASERAAIYNMIEIVPVSALSKRMRNAVKRGTRLFGQRVLWPEPMAIESLLELPVHADITTVVRRDARLALKVIEKELNRAIKRQAEPAILEALARAIFLEGLL